MSNLTPEEKIAVLSRECDTHYNRWYDLYENGGSDPTWEDGYNLNIVRNQIIYCKTQLEDICGEIGYFLPEICSRETPPKVNDRYMAKTDVIAATAKKALEVFKQTAEYNKLLQYRDVLSDKEKNKICYDAVLGYVTGLEIAIQDNNFVAMRRYRYYERYLESFKDCLKRVGKELWNRFTDVPVDPETECIDVDFLDFPKGTHREDIWHWFEDQFGLRIYDLLYK